MDARVVESWHQKINSHPDNSRQTPGVLEVDAFDRVSPRKRAYLPRVPLAGAGSFSNSELANLAVLASVYAPDTTLCIELRREILRRNR